MKKLLIIIAILCVFAAFLVSCGKPTATPTTEPTATPTSAPTTEPTATPTVDPAFSDRDHDGLYDAVDPAPDDSHYLFRYGEWDVGNRISAEDGFTVDYRYFLEEEPDFNPDLAKMSLLLLGECCEGEGSDPIIENNVYENAESRLCRTLVQFGCEEITTKDLTLSGFTTDVYDVVGVWLGNHVYYAEDGKAYQVFFVVMQSYPSETGIEWLSNLDAGADTPSYYAATGEHPEWLDKKNHKGFEIAARRIYAEITEYVKTHKKEGTSPIFFNTGHSRGGAVVNLVGKFMTDDGLKNLTYGFSVPNTTTESDPAVLASYRTVFSLCCENDFITMVPIPEWGFTKYGKIIPFNVAENPAAWEAVWGCAFRSLEPETLASYRALLSDIMPDRESIYEFLPYRSSDLYFCNSYEKAVEKQKELHAELGEESAKFVKTEIEKRTVGWVVKYTFAPAIITCMLTDLMQNRSHVSSVLPGFVPYLKYLSRFGTKVTRLFGELPDSFDVFAYPHLRAGSLVGLRILNATR